MNRFYLASYLVPEMRSQLFDTSPQEIGWRDGRKYLLVASCLSKARSKLRQLLPPERALDVLVVLKQQGLLPPESGMDEPEVYFQTSIIELVSVECVDGAIELLPFGATFPEPVMNDAQRSLPEPMSFGIRSKS